MKTQRGIYKDLFESTYIFEFRKFKFVFSSMFYLNKFKNTFFDYATEKCDKLSKELGFKFDSFDLYMVQLYKKIEKRGFLVYYYNERLNEEFIVVADIL